MEEVGPYGAAGAGPGTYGGWPANLGVFFHFMKTSSARNTDRIPIIQAKI